MAEGLSGQGSLLYGSNGMPIFADMQAGTGMPVYVKWPFDAFGTITIAWENGDDLDILGYWVGSGARGVGWSHSSNDDAGGFYAKWRGDNTSGGPEFIYVGTDEDMVLTGDITFRLHCNWYRCGRPKKTGGQAIVTATGKDSTTKTGRMNPSNRTRMARYEDGAEYEVPGGAATSGDPYIDIVYDRFGRVKSVG